MTMVRLTTYVVNYSVAFRLWPALKSAEKMPTHHCPGLGPKCLFDTNSSQLRMVAPWNEPPRFGVLCQGQIDSHFHRRFR